MPHDSQPPTEACALRRSPSRISYWHGQYPSRRARRPAAANVPTAARAATTRSATAAARVLSIVLFRLKALKLAADGFEHDVKLTGNAESRAHRRICQFDADRGSGARSYARPGAARRREAPRASLLLGGCAGSEQSELVVARLLVLRAPGPLILLHGALEVRRRSRCEPESSLSGGSSSPKESGTTCVIDSDQDFAQLDASM